MTQYSTIRLEGKLDMELQERLLSLLKMKLYIYPKEMHAHDH